MIHYNEEREKKLKNRRQDFISRRGKVVEKLLNEDPKLITTMNFSIENKR